MGDTIFVSGDESQGRTALMRAVASELARSRSLVLAGRFEQDHFEPWQTADPRTPKALELLKAVTSMAEALTPAIGLFSLILTEGSAAWQLVSEIKDQKHRVDPAVLLPQLLRMSARQRPVACIVDHADDAYPGWWADLTTLFAKEIVSELPALLVLGLDGPIVLDGDDRQGSSGREAARLLTRRDLAHWWPLAPIAEDQLAQWIGPAEPVVVDELMRASDGHSAIAAQVWHGWKSGGVVSQSSPDGCWILTSDGQASLLVERLKRITKHATLTDLERVRTILSVAALEGREFTAEAVADAVQLTQEVVLRCLDTVLAPSTAFTAGVVERIGSIALADGNRERVVWMYRFVREVDYLTLRYRSLTAKEIKRYSLRLARGLVGCYAPAKVLVAATAARLFDAGGEPDTAIEFWRLTRVGANSEITSWRAASLLEGVAPCGVVVSREAAEVLVAAARDLYLSGHPTDGLALAQAALRFAPPGSYEQLDAYYYSAWFRMNLDQIQHARSELHAALDVARHLRINRRIADVTHQLGNLDFKDGNYAQARERYVAVLPFRAGDQDPAGIATVKQALADIDLMEGNLERAESQLVEAHQIECAIGDSYRQVMTLRRLGMIACEKGEPDHARSKYREALEICRAHRDRYAASLVRFDRATLAYEENNFRAARADMLEAKHLHSADPTYQARIHRWLGAIGTALGDAPQARHEYQAALDLYRSLADTQSEQEISELLDEVDAE